ncbi:MAG: hypothetical protein JWR03_2381 [Cohnella sp.]|nr:hypothetical protein [Cohnella sp.]
MKKISLLMIASLACTFYVGYTFGDKNNDSKPQDSANQTIHSRWVKEAKPPLPEILIDGVKIEVVRGSYTWCAPSLSKEGSCVSVDGSIPELTATMVPAGLKIDTKAPQGIKEFTITNTNKDFNGDPYFVPKNKGVYLYMIHCDWFLDQGQSDYFFSVEVA